MAPQQPAQQADFSTILPILALAMNRKGGGNSGDLSNIFNELMGVMSNSYSAPSQMSDEEIMSVYAPQTISLQNTDDPILQGILADIQSGTPALKIKEAIRQGIANGSIKPVGGPDDLSLYDGLVDELFAEKKQVDQKRYEVQNKETVYEQYGLPDPSEQFDVNKLFPEIFSSLAGNVESARKTVAPKLKQIEGKYNLGPEPTYPGKEATLDDIIKKKIDITIANKTSQQDKNWASTLAKRIKNYEDGKDVNISTTGKSEWMDEADYNQMVAQLQSATGYKLKSKKQAENTKDTYYKRAQMNYEKELAGAAAPQRVASLNQTGLINPRTGKLADTSKAVQGSVTRIPTENLRDPVLQEQKIMDLVSKKLQERLASRGETPFNQALLNRIIVNQSMGK
jgi:hypothetical protein